MQIKLNVDLSPVIKEDKKDGGFITYFEEYPNAIGDGNSKEEALDSLALVFSVMLKNEPDIIASILKKSSYPVLDFKSNSNLTNA